MEHRWNIDDGNSNPHQDMSQPSSAVANYSKADESIHLMHTINSRAELQQDCEHVLQMEHRWNIGETLMIETATLISSHRERQRATAMRKDMVHGDTWVRKDTYDAWR